MMDKAKNEKVHKSDMEGRGGNTGGPRGSHCHDSGSAEMDGSKHDTHDTRILDIGA